MHLYLANFACVLSTAGMAMLFFLPSLASATVSSFIATTCSAADRQERIRKGKR